MVPAGAVLSSWSAAGVASCWVCLVERVWRLPAGAEVSPALAWLRVRLERVRKGDTGSGALNSWSSLLGAGGFAGAGMGGFLWEVAALRERLVTTVLSRSLSESEDRSRLLARSLTAAGAEENPENGISST